MSRRFGRRGPQFSCRFGRRASPGRRGRFHCHFSIAAGRLPWSTTKKRPKPDLNLNTKLIFFLIRVYRFTVIGFFSIQNLVKVLPRKPMARGFFFHFFKRPKFSNFSAAANVKCEITRHNARENFLAIVVRVLRSGELCPPWRRFPSRTSLLVAHNHHPRVIKMT